MAINTLQLLNELNNDPAGLGYKADQELRPTNELLNLLLSTRTAANPDPAPQVLKSLTLTEIMALVPDEEIANFGLSDAEFLRTLVAEQDRIGLTNTLGLCLKKGWITEATAVALQGELTATVDDPNHPAQVKLPPRAVELWGADGRSIKVEWFNQILGR